MSTITAVVHTKNSGKTLETCLHSLRWCDEVFVVDMESTDDTVSIAKKYDATIFHEKQIKIVEPMRNKYLEKVKTEWTLIVDSDEEVPETLAKKLRQLMMTQGVNAYKLPRANIIFGKWIEHTGFWPDYIVRFFRTGKCTFPPYVHADPIIDGVTETVEAHKEFALLHHHYDSIEQYVMRLNVYTSMEVEKQELQSTHFLQAFFDEFYSRFFARQGYKDGSHGLVISLLQAIYMMVVQLKLWEKTKNEMKVSLDDVEATINDACSDAMYWSANERIKTEKNTLKRIGYKIKRKLNS
ncbi:MAG: glycosyltransferase family 2 protein [Candidatus Woesebacteria bacterium]